jgi:alkylation response protein AidB-like acyl-CoA dehydrogenase
MEGTSTWSIRLNEVFVPDADIIADPAQLVMRRIREAFILLQTGMAMGIVEGSIGDMRDVEGQLGHVNRFLSDRPDELAGELAELRTTIMRLAETPQDGSIDYMVDVLDARAQASDLALRASQSALLHQGARGYLHAATPQRRVREAHFAAIVTPAIKHLRWEMARLLRDEVPA